MSFATEEVKAETDRGGHFTYRAVSPRWIRLVTVLLSIMFVMLCALLVLAGMNWASNRADFKARQLTEQRLRVIETKMGQKPGPTLPEVESR